MTGEMIQIGVMGLRDPMTGKVVENVPLYIEKCEGDDELKAKMCKRADQMIMNAVDRYLFHCDAGGLYV